MLSRRSLAGLATFAAAVALLPLAQAQESPAKPVSLVVPFAPGGPTDAMARLLAAALKGPLGQPVIVDNKAGAGGNIGAEAVARAAPDGYTLLFGTSGPLAINQHLYAKMGYDPARSFAPVIDIGALPNVLVVHPSVPATNVRELIALARGAQAGKLSYASSGNGASSHLAGVLFNLRAGTQLQHIPYKGTGPALNDLLGGQVAMTFTDVLTALPHIRAGKLRPLGVTTVQRSDVLPEVPTLVEQGLKDFDVSVFFGIVAPAGTPEPVLSRLNRAFVQALAEPEVRERLSAQGLLLTKDSSPAALAAHMRKESALWQDVVKAAGAKID